MGAYPLVFGTIYELGGHIYHPGSDPIDSTKYEPTGILIPLVAYRLCCNVWRFYATRRQAWRPMGTEAVALARYGSIHARVDLGGASRERSSSDHGSRMSRNRGSPYDSNRASANLYDVYRGSRTKSCPRFTGHRFGCWFHIRSHHRRISDGYRGLEIYLFHQCSYWRSHSNIRPSFITGECESSSAVGHSRCHYRHRLIACDSDSADDCRSIWLGFNLHDWIDCYICKLNRPVSTYRKT